MMNCIGTLAPFMLLLRIAVIISIIWIAHNDDNVGVVVAAAAAYSLITFDVDGTLVKGSGWESADPSAHSRAFAVACGKVFNTAGAGRPTPAVATLLDGTQYHGSTDGLILLRLAKAAYNIDTDVSFPRLDEMMDAMYEYIAGLDDHEISRGINVLPGVIENLNQLAAMKDEVACGLVTGNVEGIAKHKMRAVGVLDTGVLAPPSIEQQQRQQRWLGAQNIGFLGGFGSDYCSGDIGTPARNHLDRAEQIAIATQRCLDSLNAREEEKAPPQLTRVVHVGDAPGDVLAAKSFALDDTVGTSATQLNAVGIRDNLCVGMVGVATGSYSADLLREMAGDPIPGRWEPVILEKGMADPRFLAACGLD